MEASRLAARTMRVRDRLSKEGLGSLWVTGLTNIRYLTGFTGSFAQLLVGADRSVFLTDGRYREQSETEVSGCEIEVFRGKPWARAFAEVLRDRSEGSVGYEAAHLTCEGLEKVRSALGEGADREWRPTSGWIEEGRLSKDEGEIDRLRRSGRVVDRVYRELLEHFVEGVTELEIFRRTMNLFWEHGASDASFDPIVLFGARSSLPHGKPSEARLRKGDWVLLDFGAVVEGYCSDCTRTFVYGEPTAMQRERRDCVKRAHEAAIAAARPGIPCREVDKVARGVLAEAGLEDAFIHGLGHGIGLEIHEGPRLNDTTEETLAEGMTVTIEPGVYFPGWGGIRIEDAVVVRTGGAEPLTRCDSSIQPFD